MYAYSDVETFPFSAILSRNQFPVTSEMRTIIWSLQVDCCWQKTTSLGCFAKTNGLSKISIWASLGQSHEIMNGIFAGRCGRLLFKAPEASSWSSFLERQQATGWRYTLPPPQGKFCISYWCSNNCIMFQPTCHRDGETCLSEGSSESFRTDACSHLQVENLSRDPWVQASFRLVSWFQQLIPWDL